MSMVRIIFSPVGGTQKAMDMLTENFSENKMDIDLTDAKINFEGIVLNSEDIAVIAVPSYGGRVPSLAAERLKKISAKSTKCIIMCVYGNRAYEDTLIELKDIAEKDGFNVIAAISSVAEHSIIHKYAKGRPDDADRAELHSFAEQIIKKLDSEEPNTTPVIPGNRPYKKAGAAILIPKTSKKCDNCGICSLRCPAQAISYEKDRATDSKKCIECMRCVEICHKSARKVSKALTSIAAMSIKKACSERKNNELML